ncbi:MAG: methyltransferase domain-containing protein [Nitratireductor sp.]|uniref:methyltransferase domain-containing protein n=1 Tax=Bauldia litoralis TaxID=665467 RepID=UPI003296E800
MTSWLHEQRLAAVLGALRDCRARTVLDLGCGDGALLMRLAADPAIERIVGVDLSAEALARLRTDLGRLPGGQGNTVALIHGSLTDLGSDLAGFDAAVLVEVIEHIDPDRLSTVARAVFGDLAPATVIVTTPNSEFNALLGVPTHRFRHPDHRFEWGRAKFRAWAEGVAGRHGYDSAISDIGAHPTLGGPTQMAIFTRRAENGKREVASPPHGL